MAGFCAKGLAQSSAATAVLRGVVHDAQGRPAAGGVVQLAEGDATHTREAKTDAQGQYVFQSLSPGSYGLHIEIAESHADVPAVFLRAGETKTVDLTLVPRASSQKPEFFDPPNFTISGVTDTTSLGGHGSDSVVRTRESLAKDTLTLGKAGDPSAPSADAQNLLRERLAREPDNAQLHHQLADMDERLGDSLDAAHEYQRAAELEPAEPHLFDWGAELLLHHAPEPAQEVFSRGNRLFPHSARMLMGWGAALFARGASDQAAEKVGEAADLNPDDPAPYLFLGKMLNAESAPSAAVLTRLRRFAERHPESALGNYYYASALWKTRPTGDNSAQVETLLQRAIAVDPHCAEAHLQLGIVYAEHKDFPKAIVEYQQAIASNDKMAEPHFRLAQADRQIGETEKAKTELQIYDRITRGSAQTIERERREVRQFVYALRDPAK